MSCGLLVLVLTACTTSTYGEVIDAGESLPESVEVSESVDTQEYATSGQEPFEASEEPAQSSVMSGGSEEEVSASSNNTCDAEYQCSTDEDLEAELGTCSSSDEPERGVCDPSDDVYTPSFLKRVSGRETVEGVIASSYAEVFLSPEAEPLISGILAGIESTGLSLVTAEIEQYARESKEDFSITDAARILVGLSDPIGGPNGPLTKSVERKLAEVVVDSDTYRDLRATADDHIALVQNEVGSKEPELAEAGAFIGSAAPFVVPALKGVFGAATEIANSGPLVKQFGRAVVAKGEALVTKLTPAAARLIEEIEIQLTGVSSKQLALEVESLQSGAKSLPDPHAEIPIDQVVTALDKLSENPDLLDPLSLKGKQIASQVYQCHGAVHQCEATLHAVLEKLGVPRIRSGQQFSPHFSSDPEIESVAALLTGRESAKIYPVTQPEAILKAAESVLTQPVPKDAVGLQLAKYYLTELMFFNEVAADERSLKVGLGSLNVTSGVEGAVRAKADMGLLIEKLQSPGLTEAEANRLLAEGYFAIRESLVGSGVTLSKPTFWALARDVARSTGAEPTINKYSPFALEKLRELEFVTEFKAVRGLFTLPEDD